MAGRKKGTPKTGGRQKGTPNKAGAEIKTFLTSAIADYMQPKKATKKQPTLADDLRNMQPVERVRAMATLAGYVIPKQQAISVEEQAKIEEDALTAWLESAPEEAINGIAAKVLELQAKHRAAMDPAQIS